MEQQLLRDIQITLQHGVTLVWVGYIVLALLLGLMAYLGAYLRKKAENLATQEDVRKLTRIAEEVRSIYTQQLEMLSHENRLRLAALEQRLRAHQQAYTLWWQLYRAVHSPEIHNVVVQCQDWYSENCLYLNPKAREAFVDAYRSADLYSEIRKSEDVSVEAKSEDWRKIKNAGDKILQSAGLPSFKPGEIHLSTEQDG